MADSFPTKTILSNECQYINISDYFTIKLNNWFECKFCSHKITRRNDSEFCKHINENHNELYMQHSVYDILEWTEYFTETAQTIYICNICKKEFDVPYNLREHALLHITQNFDKTISFSNYSENSEASCSSHTSTASSSSGTTSNSSLQATTDHNIWRYFKITAENVSQCNICKKCFKQSQRIKTLAEHLWKMHKMEGIEKSMEKYYTRLNTYQCILCNLIISLPQDEEITLLDHIETEHAYQACISAVFRKDYFSREIVLQSQTFQEQTEKQIEGHTEEHNEQQIEEHTQQQTKEQTEKHAEQQTEEQPSSSQRTSASNREQPSTSQRTSASNQEQPSISQRTSATNRVQPSSSQITSASNQEQPFTLWITAASNREQLSTSQRTSASNRAQPSSSQITFASNQEQSSTSQITSASNREQPSTSQRTSTSNRAQPSPLIRTSSITPEQLFTLWMVATSIREQPSTSQRTSASNREQPSTLQRTSASGSRLAFDISSVFDNQGVYFFRSLKRLNDEGNRLYNERRRLHSDYINQRNDNRLRASFERIDIEARRIFNDILNEWNSSMKGFSMRYKRETFFNCLKCFLLFNSKSYSEFQALVQWWCELGILRRIEETTDWDYELD